MDIQIVSLNQRSNCLIRTPHFSGSFSKSSSFHSLLRFSAKPKNNTISSAMKSYKLSDLSKTEVDSLKARPRIDFSSIFSTVQPIVDDVRNRGDVAVTDFLDKIIERVLDPAVKEAFDVAYDNIYAFHYAQKAPPVKVENMKGVRCKRVSRCITSVGLYVPGGTAVLPSTALMLAVPAQIAGCKIVVLATPPGKDGSICKEVLYCAKKAGVTHILKAGGAQAISAMAWGTSSCPKVEKIFGPGNQYVTAAKMILQNSEAMVSIDMPAGPSEVLVIADKHASPAHIAADLLSQAISFSNLYAPEHLIMNVKDAENWEEFIENAGSIFLGPWTPESMGDYASGTNHVLPTYGYSRMYSGVSLDSFLKIENCSPHVVKMAEVEGLEAHKRAVTLRLQDIEARAPV
ncbi:hypothetical protein MKW92_014290 [Papaver armeniacum]|nr:hypothetical protein MKW92_014290 [Papaver armeniacum]